MSIFTLGVWRVKAGHAEDFVRPWQHLAERTKADFPGATASLLQDRDDPLLFISSGPWESADQVAAWRSSPTFTESVGAIREHLESFEPHTMDVMVAVE